MPSRSIFLLVLCLLGPSAFSAGLHDYVDMSSFDKRSKCEYVSDFFRTVYAEPSELYQKFIHRKTDFQKTLKPSVGIDGLLVLIHGHNAHPYQWWAYLAQTPAFLSGWSVYAPEVLLGGNVYLDEAVDPIFHQIQSWSYKNRDKPIVLIGTSLGGRIALELSNRLKDNRVFLISLAGAIGGSSLLSLGEKMGLARFLEGKPIREELTENSPRTKKLLRDARRRAHMGKIHYVFIGSTFDHLLLKSSLAFPHLTLNPNILRHILLKSASHSEIVTSSLPIIYQILKEWLENGSISSSLDGFIGVATESK